MGFVVFEKMKGMTAALEAKCHKINGRVISVQLAVVRQQCQAFVAGLGYMTSETAVREALSQYGHVLRYQRPARGKRQAAYVFVTFASEEEANRAVGAGCVEVEGRMLKI
ncbi:heterogeneous nuclear ribonucleoprotein A/B-like [Panulirus ornatus]|uniref:heterogeneous nuclear ribonucleoprotein A/B-like n=1 Tax=Panulirus ornatus TaxID=150431 RepID=UPI003A848D5A